MRHTHSYVEGNPGREEVVKGLQEEGKGGEGMKRVDNEVGSGERRDRERERVVI